MTGRYAPVAIAGTGRVAQAIGRLLADAGQQVAAVGGRSAARAEHAASFVGASVKAASVADLPSFATHVLIAVPDDAIAAVAADLARAGMRTGTAVHTSGAHGPQLLATLAAVGVSCGVLHPLQTVATPERGLAALRGATFGIGGDPDATRWAEHVVALLEGTSLRIAAGGFASYHAGAVMAGNAVIAALDAAVVLLGAAGVERAAARRAVGPLCVTSARNTIDLGPEAALTGPVQRGDVATVRTHVSALEACPPYVGDLYRASARALLDISRRRGLTETSVRAIEEALDR